MDNIADRIKKLRQLMQESKVDYYFVPAADPHKNEYVPEHWQRRQWITGFTGSAGDALIGMQTAYLWTDPRYFLQAELQLDNEIFQLIKMGQGDSISLNQWLLQQKDNFVFAVDPKVIDIDLANKIQSSAKIKNGRVLFIEENWIDTIWQKQPPLPQLPIKLHEIHFSGKNTTEKLQQVRFSLKEKNAESLIINTLEAIAWLFNIRGNDIAYNPLVISNAIISQEQATLFVDPQKISTEASEYFKKNMIQTKSLTEFNAELQNLKGNVWCDPNGCNYWIKQQLQNVKLIEEPSPINLMKALKNSIEQDGMRQAHIYDAIPVIEFMHWLENNWREGVTELSAAKKLEFFRYKNPLCLDLSFNTISGFGSHGAIIHYAATEETDTEINNSSLYLIDSGGQYQMGTTDITRTIHLGTPTEIQRHHYTLVLKGHLALRNAIFPDGTCGEHLNAFAHAPLWQEALDYGHGTGHGVGCYSCVHQSPPSISSRYSNAPLKPGMVVSNEPGLYIENQYGIRIENLCLIQEAYSKKQSLTQHGPFYKFEDLTLVPYAKNLINKAELTMHEISAINQYHEKIYLTLKNYLNNNVVAEWLLQATAPL